MMLVAMGSGRSIGKGDCCRLERVSWLGQMWLRCGRQGRRARIESLPNTQLCTRTRAKSSSSGYGFNKHRALPHFMKNGEGTWPHPVLGFHINWQGKLPASLRIGSPLPQGPRRVRREDGVKLRGLRGGRSPPLRKCFGLPAKTFWPS